MDTHNTLTTADEIELLLFEIEVKQKRLGELGVSLAEPRATLSVPIPTPTAPGISTAIVDAPPHNALAVRFANRALATYQDLFEPSARMTEPKAYRSLLRFFDRELDQAFGRANAAIEKATSNT